MARCPHRRSKRHPSFSLDWLERRILLSGKVLFVTSELSGGGSIGEYASSGAPVDASLLTEPNGPGAIAVSGADLLVADRGSDTIGEFGASGAIANAALLTVPSQANGIAAIAVSGANLFVAENSGTVAEYTTSGTLVNSAVVTGLANESIVALAVSASDLFVATGGGSSNAQSGIGEYAMSGMAVNANLVALPTTPFGIAVAGAHLLVSDNSAISEYSTSGMLVNASLVPTVGDIVVSGSDLFVANGNGIGEYTTAGATVNATLIQGSYTSIAVTGAVTAAAQLAFGQLPGNVTAGDPINPSLLVAVEDASGNVATTDSSDVTLAINSGPAGAVLSGTLTAQAVNGVATFPGIFLDTAGTYTLETTDSATSLPAVTSNSFAVAPVTLKLVIGRFPKATAGAALRPAVVVDVESLSGKIIRTNDSSVTLALASGPTGGTLGGTTTVTARNGVATFSDLVFDTAGTYTLAVSDIGAAITTSGNLNVAAAAPARIVLSALPASVAAGSVVPGPISVTVADAFGNPVSNSTSVRLLIATETSKGMISGTTTVRTNGGTATFSNVYFKTQGTYTLKAQAEKASGLFSSLIVTPGAAAKLMITKPSARGTTNTALSPALMVRVEDAFNNLISGSEVTLSESSGAAGGLGGTLTAATASDGIATFDDVVFSQTGSYVLLISDGNAKMIKTGRITIT